ncbi:uncharacterized protein K489DRAFT_328392 [Dissoconium aciculare CBS 342.82]|uniref:Altered inheritance of mitochondria protein 24, mitochondrial n=1 Tax=Dissoconium aciculare CBS 342.82 TaxID=1314786 RepID=A0A6J3LQX8_9PEZI|nr:uncharacterized protein K489DRAFT_328392 [Dissoconium aciculare CBS 342.82]KAF1818028.1 hypothetical protein K489DRAFT_328392 [Dissoconium aciculare CBS 342.82]
MRRQALQQLSLSCRQSTPRQVAGVVYRRHVQISATPSSTEPQQSLESASSRALPAAERFPSDARFEVLGGSFSLLSASISASQHLYTRKGSLVGFNGKPDNAVSTLSLLEPFRRAFLGIPFIYQKVSSTTPFTALIATKSPITSLVVVHLDGRLDWMVAQRNSLLAWTGHTLNLAPRFNTSMSIAHWGNTRLTGRGLVALSGKGLIHQITLKAGEEYVVHPSSVIAYSMMQHAPQPFRFKSSSLRLQIPNPLSWLPDTRFWRTMREAAVWRFLRETAFALRTWTRRSIWGDRLFLHFRGPVTILVQSRSGNALSDSLTTRDVNEIADAPAGAVPSALTISPSDARLSDPTRTSSTSLPPSSSASPTKMTFASVGGDGKVAFEKS